MRESRKQAIQGLLCTRFAFSQISTCARLPRAPAANAAGGRGGWSTWGRTTEGFAAPPLPNHPPRGAVEPPPANSIQIAPPPHLLKKNEQTMTAVLLAAHEGSTDAAWV